MKLAIKTEIVVIIKYKVNFLILLLMINILLIIIFLLLKLIHIYNQWLNLIYCLNEIYITKIQKIVAKL
jgi:hypothetical protein